MAMLVLFGSLLLSVISGCGFATVPLAFDDQMRREAWGLSSSAVRAPDGSFETEAVGKLRRPVETLADGTGVSASIDIGSRRPVECLFFAEDADLATTIRAMAEKALADSGEKRGSRRFKRVHRVDAGSIGAAPFLAVEWVYATGVERAHQKHRIAARDGLAIYCRHLETGYGKTFAHLFERLVRNLQVSDPGRRPPYFVAIALSRSSGRPIGVEYTTLTRDGDDGVRISRRASTLRVVGGSTLTATDTIHVSFASLDGRLVSSAYGRSENGVLVADLSLDSDGEDWSITGTLDGAPLESVVEQRALHSRLGVTLSLRRALRDQGSGASSTLRVWSPGAAPGSPVALVYEVVGERDDGYFDVTSSCAGVTRHSVVDVMGVVKSERVVLASEEIEATELYRDGSF